MEQFLKIQYPFLYQTRIPPFAQFCTPWKRKKTRDFLTFSREYRNGTLMGDVFFYFHYFIFLVLFKWGTMGFGLQRVSRNRSCFANSNGSFHSKKILLEKGILILLGVLVTCGVTFVQKKAMEFDTSKQLRHLGACYHILMLRYLSLLTLGSVHILFWSL